MCINPQFKNYSIVDGKVHIDWKSSGFVRFPGDKVIELVCGNCLECQKQRSSEWASRCVIEAKEHSQNCILTLTYDDEHCPDQLMIRDYQLFMKRLRKFLSPRKIKYFCSGEYGSLRGRPHYHIIIFGYMPSDVVWNHKDKKGTILGTSSEISKLWTYGYHTVGQVDYQSCLYAAKYMQKSLSDGSVLHSCLGEDFQRPFIRVSHGIGRAYAERLSETSDRIYISGKSYNIPRYFDKVREKNGVDLTTIKMKRIRSFSHRYNLAPFYQLHPFGYSEDFKADFRDYEHTLRNKQENEKKFVKGY